MNLNELRYLVAVAQERSFRRAAERCFISQPALSLAIQKLEDELSVRLLERSKTEVTVTPIGERVIEQAQRALEEIGRIKDIARQGQDQLVGPLSLGVIYTVGPYLLPALIPVLRRRAPGMPLAVEENLTENLEVLLRNGKLDVALIALPFDAPGIITRPLYDEAFEVVLPAEHPWASRSSIKAKELSKERVLLLTAGHCFSNQVTEACPELAARGGQIQQGNSLETIRNMVASGLGITVLPCSANMTKFRSPLLKAVPFATPSPSRRIALAWRRSFFRGEAVEALAQAIRGLNIPCLTMLPEG
ncbi:MAG: hydrogen peroxide-inducible genes activator [Chromatiales bacterium]